MKIHSQIEFRAICVFGIALCLVSMSFAQVRRVYDMGAIGLGQKLKRIANTKRIMHIGAHPDDEDSDMLAYLARKENARVVYLSLTRGDGGQNVIGPELFEPLGVIRTEELLQARNLDGAEQLFTRAFDYGYSKTLAEAKSKWDEEIIKCDVVRAIRKFRPQVVVPRFSGTPADGHGQHQYAGYIAPIAVKAASDPNQCKYMGEPWKVTKFYVGQGFRDRNEPGLKMNTGAYDYLLGRSYYEIAAQGRSQHKTQEQGSTELKGDRFSGVNLVESDLVVRGAEDSMFDGLDTSFRSMTKSAGTAAKLSKIEAEFVSAANSIQLSSPAQALEVLFKTRNALRNLVESDGSLSDVDRIEINSKIKETEDAIRHASGLQIDALADTETIADEESFGAKVNIFFPEDSGITIKAIDLDMPEGWDVDETEAAQPDNSPFARFFRETPRASKSYTVEIPTFAAQTQPYFLEQSKKGYLYHWEDDPNQGLPFQKPLIYAVITADIGGQDFEFRQPVEYRFAHDTRGELRRNLNIVPKVSVDLDQDLVFVRQEAQTATQHVSVNVRSNSSKPLKGRVRLVTPKSWTAKVESDDFEISKKGAGATFDFSISIDPKTAAGDYLIKAIVEIDGREYSQRMNTIEYDHIQSHRYYTPAETKVVIADLKVAPVKVGYVMGSGDSGPEALRQMGLDVEILDKKTLMSGDLSVYDTIMIGIRASETNDDYVANNRRLLEYVNQGGTMIVQYQKRAYQSLNLAPYPVQLGDRVAEEDAAVKILETGHPVFNYPNKITQKDFEGWVQERNLYAILTVDERYTPLLEAHDTGDSENNGGMVYAKIGKGKYMYVSYAFFRQLPAGVPGAYRLYANIVSLGRE